MSRTAEVARQLEWHKQQPKSTQHRGLAFYDKERMNRQLEMSNTMRLLPPTGAIAEWMRDYCPEVDLTAENRRGASGTNWNPEDAVVLKQPWKQGRFHDTRRFTATATPAALPTQLEFDGPCRAAFTFVEPGFAAKAQNAIERIRAGKLLAKDLPKHIANPPVGLTATDGKWRSSRGQRWWKPDANGYKQLVFGPECWPAKDSH